MAYGAFFQIGLDCVMSHHHIEGLCTFLFKFWRENSKWSSCQQLVLHKDFHAAGNNFMEVWTNLCYGFAIVLDVRPIFGRNSILNFPAKI